MRFNVEVKDSDTGKAVSIPFERRVERNVKVRGAGDAEHRPVVLMKMCIGNQFYNEQFSLKSRGKMLYPVLIGRRTLEHLGAVDVSSTFTREPKCKKATPWPSLGFHENERSTAASARLGQGPQTASDDVVVQLPASTNVIAAEGGDHGCGRLCPESYRFDPRLHSDRWLPG